MGYEFDGDDSISRQAAIDAVKTYLGDYEISKTVQCRLRLLPSAQPEISRIEQELHGKTPEEQYEFLCWLLLKFALTYTDSRLAVIEWLRGGKEDE